MTQPNLESRFLPPPQWKSDFFQNEETGHQLHYGFVEHEMPRGTVILLGGLSEFSEKYYETVQDLLSRGFSVFTMDWYAQGRSTRPLKNPHKRHSKGFEYDVQDLHSFITNVVKPKSDDNPLILMAHSMGGNISMRYAITHPKTFSAIVTLSPMFEIYALKHIPSFIAYVLLWFLRPFYKLYVAGGKNWHEDVRKSHEHDIFSSDPVRKELHNIWCIHNPELQVGSPTFGWVNAAFRSCHFLKIYGFSDFNAPCLFVCADNEKLVENNATHTIAKKINNADIHILNDARHEILMERDDIRNQFWSLFDKFLADNNILR